MVLYDGPLTAAAQLSEDSSDFLVVFVVASYRSTTASGVAVPGVIDSARVDFDGTGGYVDVSGTSASGAMGIQVRKVIGFK